MDNWSRIPNKTTQTTAARGSSLPPAGSVIMASVEEDLGDGMYALRWNGNRISVTSQAVLRPGQSLILKSEISPEGKPTLVVQGPALPDPSELTGRIIYGPGTRSRAVKEEESRQQQQPAARQETQPSGAAGAAVAAGVAKATPIQAPQEMRSLLGAVLEPLEEFDASAEKLLHEAEMEKALLSSTKDKKAGQSGQSDENKAEQSSEQDAENADAPEAADAARRTRPTPLDRQGGRGGGDIRTAPEVQQQAGKQPEAAPVRDIPPETGKPAPAATAENQPSQPQPAADAASTVDRHNAARPAPPASSAAGDAPAVADGTVKDAAVPDRQQQSPPLRQPLPDVPKLLDQPAARLAGPSAPPASAEPSAPAAPSVPPASAEPSVSAAPSAPPEQARPQQTAPATAEQVVADRPDVAPGRPQQTVPADQAVAADRPDAAPRQPQPAETPVRPEVFLKEALTQIVKAAELPLTNAGVDSQSLGVGGRMPEAVVDKAAGILVRAAGLSPEPAVMEAAKILVEHNVQVDRETVQALISLVAGVDGADREALLKAAARLSARDIPLAAPLAAGLAEVLDRRAGVAQLMDQARLALTADIDVDAAVAAPARARPLMDAAQQLLDLLHVDLDSSEAGLALERYVSTFGRETLGKALALVEKATQAVLEDNPLLRKIDKSLAAVLTILEKTVDETQGELVAARPETPAKPDTGAPAAPQARPAPVPVAPSGPAIAQPTPAAPVPPAAPPIPAAPAAQEQAPSATPQPAPAPVASPSGQTAVPLPEVQTPPSAVQPGQTVPPAVGEQLPPAAPPFGQAVVQQPEGHTPPAAPHAPAQTVPPSGANAPAPVPAAPQPGVTLVAADVGPDVPTATTGEYPATTPTPPPARPQDGQAVRDPQAPQSPTPDAGQQPAVPPDAAAARPVRPNPAAMAAINAYLNSPRAFPGLEALNLPPMPKIARLTADAAPTPPPAVPQDAPAQGAQPSQQPQSPQQPSPQPGQPAPQPTPPGTPAPASTMPQGAAPAPLPAQPAVPAGQTVPEQTPQPQSPQQPQPQPQPQPSPPPQQVQGQPQPAQPPQSSPQARPAGEAAEMPEGELEEGKAEVVDGKRPLPAAEGRSAVLNRLPPLFQIPGANRPEVEILRPQGALERFLESGGEGAAREKARADAGGLARALLSDDPERAERTLKELAGKDTGTLKETAQRLMRMEAEAMRSEPLLTRLADAATSLRDLGRQLLAVKAENVAGQDRDPGVMLAEVPFKLNEDGGDGRMQMFYRRSKSKGGGWTSRVILDLNTTGMGPVLGDMRFFGQDMVLNMFVDKQETADFLAASAEGLVEGLSEKGFRAKAKFMVLPPPATPEIRAERPEIAGEEPLASGTRTLRDSKGRLDIKG